MKYRGWFGRNARRRCPHEHLRGIYGDQIIDVGFWRLRCVDCLRLLDGPVQLAASRPPSRRDDHRETADELGEGA